MGKLENRVHENIAAEVLAVDREWANHALRGVDVDKIVSYWSKDALVIAPGWPVLRGHEMIREFVTTMLSDSSNAFTWESGEIHVSDDDSMAWLHGPNFVYATAADGEKSVETGRGLTVWSRDADRRWRCDVDIWNSEG
jgi:ketosteroid isomerase-like protein